MGYIYGDTVVAGKSKEMRHIYGVVERIAPMSVNVLISGESGCGKLTLAKFIHEQSGRDGRFSVLDPSVIPENLRDGDLDGFIEEAFLSCIKGTLLIDDLANSSHRFQTRLASALSMRDRVRGGKKTALFSEVRVIASTDRNIGELARQGRFRQDLCNMLSVVSIDIPSLRQRREDIAELIGIFLEGLYEKTGCRCISKEASNILCKYDWPGNVRELENVLIHASAVAGPDGEITPSCLPAKVKRKNAALPKVTVEDELYRLAAGLIESGAHLDKSNPYGEYLKIVEPPLIKAAMDMCGNNKSLAARKIKINRNTLSKKLREYNIE